jgi:hypothetical protein
LPPSVSRLSRQCGILNVSQALLFTSPGLQVLHKRYYQLIIQSREGHYEAGPLVWHWQQAQGYQFHSSEPHKRTGADGCEPLSCSYITSHPEVTGYINEYEYAGKVEPERRRGEEGQNCFLEGRNGARVYLRPFSEQSAPLYIKSV